MTSAARFGLAIALLIISFNAHAAHAAILPLPVEQDAWSDMAFPTGLAGNYNSGTLQFALVAGPSNDLEIGAEFGPSNAGRHYGSDGTLGGAFSATLSVSGVVVASDGTVTNGGTVAVTHNGSAPGSLKDDYAFTNGGNPLGAGHVLLSGSVLEVLLDATGDDTLDVLFSITGGALQFDHPVLGTNFAPNGRGLLRIAGVALPSNWSQSFSLNGATVDVLGIPEPTAMMLVGIAAVLSLAGVRRRAYDRKRGG